jgi:hypothetical protein
MTFKVPDAPSACEACSAERPKAAQPGTECYLMFEPWS